MTNIHVDVSEHQPSAFTDAYPRSFGMFRAASEYDRPDAKAPESLAWCLQARNAGKLVNFGIYVIPGNVPNDAILGRLAALNAPTDCVIMLDVESWGGLVTGDHSTQLNTLAETLRQRQGGRSDLVWGYLNPNVDGGLWPNRPAWLGFIQPAYGPSAPPDPRGLNRIGWQYTNGTQNGTGLPSSSTPFGACDHNVMFIDYPAPGGLSVSDVQTILNAIAALPAQVAAQPVKETFSGKNVEHPLGEWIANAGQRLYSADPTGASLVTQDGLTAAVAQLKTDLTTAINSAVAAGGDPSLAAGAVVKAFAAKLSA